MKVSKQKYKKDSQKERSICLKSHTDSFHEGQNVPLSPGYLGIDYLSLTNDNFIPDHSTMISDHTN